MRSGNRKLHLSKIYSFTCFKASSVDGDHSQIGGKGYSRVVFCNEQDSTAAATTTATAEEAVILNFADNSVRSTKYTAATFLPKSLFEQFRRVANFYFLVTGVLAFTKLAPYRAVTAILPLVVVIGASIVKEGIEDWRRKKQDIEVNNRRVKVHKVDGIFEYTAWKNLRVGNIVKVEKDEFFPADLVLLSSSYEDAVCYVETMNLDGETNLKLKQGLEVTSFLHDDLNFKKFKATVKCEDPNANLYSFVGSMEFEEQKYPLSFQQLLLRDSKLRNTDYIFGAVIFTGHDTKVIQNSTDPPSKRSRVEKKMDRVIYFLFCILFLMASVGSIFFGFITKNDLQGGSVKRWYLRPDHSSIFFDPKRSAAAAAYHCLTALMLYGFFIPISLYVSIEIVKVLQSIFINQDIHMYYKEADKPAHARTSNLNEELGQVDTILSDKTGTLTCNSMEFIKCSIAGVAYGRGVTEVEKTMSRRKSSTLVRERDISEENDIRASLDKKSAIKGFNFTDERIMNGNWVNEPHADVIEKFFRLLAVCHTAIPEADKDTGNVSYEAESPDEAAFVIAARELGFEFYKRAQTSLSTYELDPVSGNKVERMYKILNVLEFNSSRKRMSVIVKGNDGKILLLCKGADSVMFERLAKNGREFEEKTMEHVHEYADAGLRTLILAYRELEAEEYKDFANKFSEAKNLISADRERSIEEVSDNIEKNLILLGATAVEDKLQNGVPDCIDKLAQAGIKIWVLTGDKMETAINIGFACSLLRQGMKQIIIHLDTPEIQALEKDGDKIAITKTSRQSVLFQIREGAAQLTAHRGSSQQAFALIIDGKSLAYALEDDMKNMFLELAIRCASVICCRSSPKQKALVTRLVKSGTGKTTLAIGDGANDVGMLQEADIGVGISGVEGMQAVMSSDIAIAQFRYLERLLLVHGHWCYRRISSMICYFFYKNVTFGFTLFLYEVYASFSGEPAYNDWFLALYNVFFSSLPVIALGVFDQDVSARYCLKFPLLYQEGVENILFSWRRVLSWMLNGFFSALLIFFFCTKAMEIQAFDSEGRTAGREILGATMYTCVVWVVNLQMALSISYFTLIQHIFIWGSIFIWYIFLLIYGAVPQKISENAYKVFVESLAPSPSYWIVTLFVVISTLIPYFSYNAIQMRFFPMYHEMVQWIRYEGKTEDPDYCNMVRQRSLQPTTVGSTARLAAKANQSLDKNIKRR
ncbi:putative phospholipid-transporting ATPase 9 isoform X2 [Trifolium pratense]|uniref:putative phospholipid-transporting ATPase 9 isoform X2 n=1 Tax=Trifolium pratense TaxID=57577 RepID=UPI001E69290B|nr:putative phospholipid-transporting ATPase 9 isoform X2 [Trifolium pratense]XP_045833290.1 putative phospholipid-transporting ATPase 9 isoform X2 [Trifolium pratense]XP_045833291.1 putative phospholipid-transporting ATPase 9 isoform X2 [Trifolium pratense]